MWELKKIIKIKERNPDAEDAVKKIDIKAFKAKIEGFRVKIAKRFIFKKNFTFWAILGLVVFFFNFTISGVGSRVFRKRSLFERFSDFLVFNCSPNL